MLPLPDTLPVVMLQAQAVEGGLMLACGGARMFK